MTPAKSLYKDIVRRTESGELKWKEVDRNAPPRILRGLCPAKWRFAASALEDGKNMQYVLADRADWRNEHHLFPVHEDHSSRLMIFEDEQLVEILSPVELNWAELTWLTKTIAYFGEHLPDFASSRG
ncbi:hypothetical protein [Pseudoduganella namucuonensis]|uniref:Uncharacterized protein n=1 Tax=Pseudoduganella namucuonensis TaxID=1035707 RepID=A0A1I7JLA2_9BURK|nr:hypothetical protein [Pseudoduganella namucuonensis]SFU85975.1 hypothetical protein SAMN05216552_101224 [Pseudoduganella namucuonensis]